VGLAVGLGRDCRGLPFWLVFCGCVVVLCGGLLWWFVCMFVCVCACVCACVCLCVCVERYSGGYFRRFYK